ncbi:hypothetical protein CCP3SC5AM1_1300004 [Gammaproteobacteria bacterium]
MKKNKLFSDQIAPIQSDNQQTLAVEILSDSAALALLADWSQQTIAELPPAALEVAHECGNLPLGLRMMGALSRGLPDSWERILRQIREIDPKALQRRFSDDPTLAPQTLRALQVALNSLEPEWHRHYLDLAIFPADVAIPMTVLRALWTPEKIVANNQKSVEENAKEIDITTIVAQFKQRALVECDDDDYFHLQAIQRVYLQKYAGNRSALHARFLRNIATQLPHTGTLPSWDNLPRDEFYLWQYLPYHLANAGQYTELSKLLTDLNWLDAQLEMVDLSTIDAMYGLPPHEESLERVRGALRLATPALSKDKNQLAGQLLGRLLGVRTPGLRGLIKQAMRWKGAPWLRPLTDSLIASGGPLEHTFASPRERIQAIAVTQDGRLLIAGSAEGQIKIWDLEQWLELSTLSSQHHAINAVAITPDGQRFLLAADDGTLELWDLERREVRCTLKGHRDRVNAVVMAQNGRQAISASSDGTLKGWNLEQQALMYTLKTSGPARAIAMHPDGVHAISGGDHGIQIWDLVHRIEKRTLTSGGHQASISVLAVTPDGRKVIAGAVDSTLKILSLDQGTVIHTLKGHGGPIRGLALTPDGQWIISASTDGNLKVWDLERGMERCTLAGHHAEVATVAVTWDGRAISAGADRTLKVWDLERGADLHTLTGHRDAVNAVAVLPGGTQIISASDDRTLKIWDMKWRRAALQILTGHTRDVNAVAVSADGRCVVSASKDKTLRVWELIQGKEPKELRVLTGHSAPVRTVALTRDGQWAVSGSSDRTLRVWDLAHENTGRVLTGHQGAVTAVVMVREQEMISASLDGTLKLWNLESGTELPLLVEEIAPTVALLSLAVPGERMDGELELSDKPWVITGAEDGTLQIWLTTPGGERYVWPAHQAAITALAVSADGKIAISGSNDHTIRVWDLPRAKNIAALTTKNLNPQRKKSELIETPDLIAEFTGESPILTCAVAEDGVTIIAGEKSGRIHFLRLEALN